MHYKYDAFPQKAQLKYLTLTDDYQLDLKQAKKIISKIGGAPEKIKISFGKDDRFADGVVFFQNPNLNTIVDSNSAIEFQVNGKDITKEKIQWKELEWYL